MSTEKEKEMNISPKSTQIHPKLCSRQIKKSLKFKPEGTKIEVQRRLRASWRLLEASCKNLKHPWAFSSASWGVPGTSWAVLGTFLAHHGGVLGRLGDVLGSSSGHLDHLARLRGALGRLVSVLARLWIVFNPIFPAKWNQINAIHPGNHFGIII